MYMYNSIMMLRTPGLPIRRRDPTQYKDCCFELPERRPIKIGCLSLSSIDSVVIVSDSTAVPIVTSQLESPSALLSLAA